jgi:hypothetical protein
VPSTTILKSQQESESESYRKDRGDLVVVAVVGRRFAYTFHATHGLFPPIQPPGLFLTRHSSLYTTRFNAKGRLGILTRTFAFVVTLIIITSPLSAPRSLPIVSRVIEDSQRPGKERKGKEREA